MFVNYLKTSDESKLIVYNILKKLGEGAVWASIWLITHQSKLVIWEFLKIESWWLEIL